MKRIAAAALLLGLLAGCSPAPQAPERTGTEVRHALGTTTAPAHPARVVALGPADVDAALALGVEPVGIGLPLSAEVQPWQRRPGWEPVTLRPTDQGYSTEAIAQLHPDLILAGSDYYIDGEYAALSRLAPTTAFETAPDEEPWQTTTRQVGRALGRPAEADRLVADTERRVREAAAAHPQLAGAEVAVTLGHSPGGLGVIRSAQDVTVRTLTEFGMALSPAAANLPGAAFNAQVSAENLARIDTDVLITAYPNPAVRPQIESLPVFESLDAVRDGGYLPLTQADWPLLRQPGVLSLPYLVDHLLPRIADAARHRR
ncbi:MULTISPECIES: iron-siderophore ABC transporter substrate-binding protein [unclassified Saccharopolyspora]|uniref:iron-siderophore ABC transporter substrate-binding protein n=1 Tax=unclassified Saccharopolyspora TaxID=2646250 RepID=UPI001CD78C92|nr:MULTISPECIES: iron-siderophore ABC transporter substrate-binding protein [unclassified Saccharopolyspora]MCA1185382.1 iron-siderophore ABC transporter substrate-binding protein [Saccharopolyspora sp. 6T]MCA1194208.1 iron-siderophore ABC transporter substrate-binding protein [Saccharopolyspora sp. 6V]MCA1279353.1 iron-siderophore ABC transporter substrate-binding protein [Saccharopolyspora sp. 7B]